MFCTVSCRRAYPKIPIETTETGTIGVGMKQDFTALGMGVADDRL